MVEPAPRRDTPRIVDDRTSPLLHRPPLLSLVLASALACVLTIPLSARAQSCGFAPGVVPDGSYQRSCKNCGVVDVMLSCDCRNIAGAFVHTSIDISLCRSDPRDPMANLNGVLVCGRCDARGACCLTGGSCTAGMKFTECQAQGDFRGEGSTCGSCQDEEDEEIVTWVNGAGGDFGDSDNWEPAQVPGTGDTAKFDIDAAYLVTSATGSVGRLLVDHSDVSFSGGTLTASELSLAAPSIRVRGGGRLTLASGALQSSHAAIGDRSTVEGGGAAALRSAWSVTDTLTVGGAGAGMLVIDAGAQVVTDKLLVPDAAGASGEIHITGFDVNANIRSFLVANTMNIGGNGAGRVVIENKAQVNTNLGGTVFIGPFQGTGSMIVRGAGSTLFHDDLNVESGTLAIEDGGTAKGSNGTIDPAGAVAVRGMGVNGPSIWELTQSLHLAGIGTGTLTLEGGGLVRLPAGSLFVGAGGTISGVGTIEEVQPGGEPALESIIQGTIAPGIQRSTSAAVGTAALAETFTPGELVIDGNVVLGPSAVLRGLVSGAGEAGVLHVSGDLTLDGTLELRFIDGYLPKAGDSFDFLEVGGTMTGDFAQMTFPNLTPGFEADLSTTPDGKLRLTALTDGVARCAGDCDGGDTVSIDELLTMVNIALGNLSADRCPAGDTSGDEEITVDEILGAVNKALSECPLNSALGS